LISCRNLKRILAISRLNLHIVVSNIAAYIKSTNLNKKC